MTEAEWLACEYPDPMLEFLRGRVSERKFRLFSVACCRRTWSFQNAVLSCKAGAISDAHADGLATEPMAGSVEGDAREWRGGVHRNGGAAVVLTGEEAVEVWAAVARPETVAMTVALMVAEEARAAGTDPGTIAAMDEAANYGVVRREEQCQTALLREIIGDPFRPVTLDPSWITSTVTTLASQMYESRDFGAMPILADALQDAGCDNEDFLDHCRGSGPHVRGCWVVDLVLGSE
jgi:hypothetical protein